MKQYILVPVKGLSGIQKTMSERILLNINVNKLQAASEMMQLSQDDEFKIVDSIQENGAKLVEMKKETANIINNNKSPIRAVPLITYNLPLLNYKRNIKQKKENINKNIIIKLIDASTGKKISHAEVYAITDSKNNYGDKGVTDENGIVMLLIEGTYIEELYVYTSNEYWDFYKQSVTVNAELTIEVTPLEIEYVDSLRFYYSNSRFDISANIKVGIMDTGIGPHNDLNVVGGLNTVLYENDNDWVDIDGHGTHVAGIVGANNSSLKGVCPGVELYSYRVFGEGGQGASNFSIMKALFHAQINCDIINLSLGSAAVDEFDGVDELLNDAIKDANNHGLIVIVAAGNDYRNSVGVPASFRDSIAVSAMGVIGTFPNNSLVDKDILKPPQGYNVNEFIAAFSNIGPEISVTAPGVGVISTYPNNTYKVMSGTSMSCPVVSGAIASLLSQDTNIFKMERNYLRTDAMKDLLLRSCNPLGFGYNYEGYGLPDPNIV